MKKFLCIFACVFSLFAAELASGIGVGIDENHDTALKKAIRAGVEAAVGFRLKSEQKILNKSLKGKNLDSNGKNESFFANKKGISDEIASDVLADISSYKILEEEQKEGKFYIKVEVVAQKIAREYDLAKMNSKRRTIAVAPRFGERFFSKKDYEINANLSDKIIAELTKTRRFRVLDRDTQGLYEAEKELISSVDANRSEIAKLGQVLGADYFLIFDTPTFSETKNANPSSIIARKSAKNQQLTKISLNYRVFVMATREIKFAGVIEFETSENWQEKVASELVSEITESIYPPRVYFANSHEIAFAQALKVGDEYECYELGDMIKDIYTGEEIDFVEIPVGLVKIVRANSKTSYAKVLKGEVRRGDLCRKATKIDGSYKRDGVGEKDGVVKVGDDGGVFLPF